MKKKRKEIAGFFLRFKENDIMYLKRRDSIAKELLR